MTILEKKNILISKFEELAGKGAAAEFLSRATKAYVESLKERARGIGNPGIFDRAIKKIEAHGLSDIEAVDILRDAVLEEQAKKLSQASRTATDALVAKLAAKPATAPAESELETYTRLSEKDSRAAGEYYAANADAIIRQSAERDRKRVADINAQHIIRK